MNRGRTSLEEQCYAVEWRSAPQLMRFGQPLWLRAFVPGGVTAPGVGGELLSITRLLR